MTRPAGRHYPLNLAILSASLAICRLSPDGEIPRWVWADRAFLSITCTPDEISIVCLDLELSQNRHKPPLAFDTSRGRALLQCMVDKPPWSERG